jgi:hypothetical protein
MQPVTVGTTLTIPAVGTVPAFPVKLRPPNRVAADSVKPGANSPIFVVADTHGEYELLVAMLQTHGILDARLRWSFGRGQVVILGDVFDRGPNHTEILWLLYGLEEQAARVGGGVHLLLGNHETMVLRGDLRYLHPKYPQAARVLEAGTYAELFDGGSVLGQWLRTRPTVLKVGDLLCLHGGISRAIVDRELTLFDINVSVRAALSGAPADARTELLMGSTGPLWYRGYFAGQTDFPTASAEDIDRILAWFRVRRILLGHTIVPTITPLYDGKVIAVQVYPKREDATHVHFEALRIDGGRLRRAKFDGALEPLK